jgi:hypothetical protein
LVCLLLMAATALPVRDAGATTGLEWQWGSSGHRYRVATRLNVPTLLTFMAEQNRSVRVYEVQLDLVTRCVVADTMSSSWELHCLIEDAALMGRPVGSDDAETLGPILEEADAALTGKFAQIVFSADGQVKNVDLEGVSKADERSASIAENLRLLLLRTFSALDLELPKKGDDKGKGTWKQDNLLATSMPSSQGSMGSVTVVHSLVVTDGAPIVEINSTGRGTVASGEMANVHGEERPMNTYDVEYVGVAHFDTALGVLVDREFLVDGRVTASSVSTDGLGTAPYVQATRIQLIADGAPAPALPASGLME